MKKAVYLMALVLLLAIPAARGEETDRQAVVRALLDRSRLLADTHFSIPADLWRRYQVSSGPNGMKSRPRPYTSSSNWANTARMWPRTAGGK